MHTIFISYRRDGGEIMAQMLYDRLTALGYSVFYDVVVLKGGRFNARLLDAIEHATDFVLVLSPGALDRCVQEGDWVRQEIKHAFEHKKNIIPILLRGSSFPIDLPADIAEIRNQNGVDFTNMGYFEARFLSLVERLKTPVPVSTQSTVEVDEDYESFFQKEMKECQTMLHLIDEHWRQLVLDSEDFAPITTAATPEKLAHVLSTIDTWLDEKENFENRVNSSHDIRETGYIQGSKLKLEQYFETVTAYQERAKAFLNLSQIEKDLEQIESTDEAVFKKIAEIREHVAALPDDIAEQMSEEGKQKFAQFIKHLNTQTQFEREMAAVDKKFSALPSAIRENTYAFSHEHADTVKQDMEALDAVIELCVSVCDTYEIGGETPNAWIITTGFDHVLGVLDQMKNLFEKGKIFLGMVDFCNQIDAMAAASSLERSEIYAVAERFSSLSEEEHSYMRENSIEHYHHLHDTALKAEAIVEKAVSVDAHFAELPQDAQDGNIRYSYEKYDAAYASTVALEGWLAECQEFKTLWDAHEDKRFFSEKDVTLAQSLIYRAQSEKASLLFHSDCLTAAHELEGALIDLLLKKEFDPADIFDAADKIDALDALAASESQGKKRSHAKMLLTKDLYDKIVSYEEFLRIFYHVEDGFSFLLEHTALTLKSREEVQESARRLQVLREKSEQLLKDLAEIKQSYETVHLQDTDILSYVERASAMEAEAEKIASYGLLLDWANEKAGITDAELKNNAELKKEIKSKLHAYRKVGQDAKKYDTEKELSQAFSHIKKVYKHAGWSAVAHRVLHVGLPILTFLAFLALAVWQTTLATADFSLSFALLLATAVLNLVLLRLFTVFKKKLFLLPLIGYIAYFCGYLLPEYLLDIGYALWYLPYFVLAGVLIVILSAYVRTSILYYIFAFLCKCLAVLSTLAIIILPIWTFFQSASLINTDWVLALDSLLTGFWNLLICFVAGGVWIPMYIGSTLSLLNTALLFGMIVRRVSRTVRTHVWAQPKEKAVEGEQET